jgi:hypothetical protein
LRREGERREEQVKSQNAKVKSQKSKVKNTWPEIPAKKIGNSELGHEEQVKSQNAKVKSQSRWPLTFAF